MTAICAATMSGCASLAPPPPARSRTQLASRRPSPIARAQRSHEYPGPPAPRQSAPGAGSAATAVSAFATAYINWDARSVASDMESLARRSVGQARSELELAAAQTASDYELRRGGIANSGAVMAVVALRGSRNQYLVVTRERTTATATDAYQGLRPAWHVAVATVSRIAPGRWAVSGWQPEG